MRAYPALRITFFETPREEQLDLLLARLDDYQPTAIHDIDNGVLVFFASAAARDEAQVRFDAFELVDATPEDVPDENWAERSQAALTPVVVGRLTIAPPWTLTGELRAAAPGPIIVIQPSMGFGTGHHASTRLCLELLQQIALTGTRVLDIGTGSGVLAIAARILGAAPVTGIDVDPDALTNARENLELNGIAEGIVFVESDIQTEGQRAPQSYDVILANLTGAMLQREAPAITALAEPAGLIIVSGIQVDEAADVTRTFQADGWRIETSAESDGWVAVRFVGLRPEP